MENKASYIDYTDDEIKGLKRTVLDAPFYEPDYTPFIRTLQEYKTSHEVFLKLAHYLNNNPSDLHTLVTFQIMYHNDIENLPLYINRKDPLGEITRWRLSTGR